MNFPPTTSVNIEFSHGSYADYSGIIFYARSTDGNWIDALHISDIYIGRICDSIMELYEREDPRIVEVLCRYYGINDDTEEYVMVWGSPITKNAWGGIDLDEDVPATIKDLEFFRSELSLLTFADLYPHAYGDTETEKADSIDEFQGCIKVIDDYLSDRMARGLDIWVQDD